MGLSPTPPTIAGSDHQESIGWSPHSNPTPEIITRVSIWLGVTISLTSLVDGTIYSSIADSKSPYRYRLIGFNRRHPPLFYGGLYPKVTIRPVIRS